jgi:hypothetical protein
MNTQTQTTAQTIYQEQGFKNRKDYLSSLADDFGAERSTIYTLAGLLGPNEDFDGLITSLEDYEMGDDFAF